MRGGSLLVVLCACRLPGGPMVEGDRVGDCTDGVDNDRDGVIDCGDPDCQGNVACGLPEDTANQWPDIITSPFVTSVFWECAGSAYRYDFMTAGWADDMDLTVRETSSTTPWEEFHALVNLEFAEDGTWDRWGADLGHVSSQAAVVSGETTFFDCATQGATELAWMVRVHAQSAMVDCAVWGHEATYFNDHNGYECAVLE
ncbi:MAG: hypothetical protein EP330_28520 [Deltaproteobacteria bacterium]|nr:MAG: hypothetical protein EP330_28520 [Deltaproteobacteria bacterium]